MLADGPISYWRLDESAGSTAADAAGSNGGTYLGGVSLGVPGALTGDSDTAVTLDGSSGYVAVSDAASLDLTGDFSVEAWVRPTVVDGVAGCIVQKGKSHGYPGWQYRLSITSGNQWQGTVFVGNSAIDVTDPGSPSTTSWTYLVMTRSGSTLTLYVNGVPVSTASVSGTLNTGTGILAIGRSGSASVDYFNGSVDEVAIYGAALSASQVADHYQAGIGG